MLSKFFSLVHLYDRLIEGAVSLESRRYLYRVLESDIYVLEDKPIRTYERHKRYSVTTIYVNPSGDLRQLDEVNDRLETFQGTPLFADQAADVLVRIGKSVDQKKVEEDINRHLKRFRRARKVKGFVVTTEVSHLKDNDYRGPSIP